MLEKDYRDFKGKHKGETIWVLGSGRSLEYIPKEFWADKTVVATNYSGHILGLSKYYMVTHYHYDARKVAEERSDIPIICGIKDHASQKEADPPEFINVYKVPTGDQHFDSFNIEKHWPTEEDTFVVGPTSMHMTMHFAHYLGAAHIVLAGVDVGSFDDNLRVDNYPPGIGDPVSLWEDYLPLVANKLRELGTSVHSLNPFVSLNLEGHTYLSARVSIN